MTPSGVRADASQLLQLSRDQQIEKARAEARQACADQGHELGAWRHAGVIADDEAVCASCGAYLFILYGNSALQPLIGARVFGTARGSRCRSTSTAKRSA